MRSKCQGHLVIFDFEIMIEIQNSQDCFVMLWRKLERTRRLLGGQYKRFCIRNVMKAWFLEGVSPVRAGRLERTASAQSQSA